MTAAFLNLMGLFPVDPGGDSERLLAALDEPAAAVSADGRVLQANAAWRAAGGAGVGGRLPRDAAGLFPALKAALAGEVGRAEVLLGGQPWRAVAARLDERRLLLRLHPPQRADQAVAPAAPAPSALDPLAQAAPFGAALLDGPDPFAANILEANRALLAMDANLARPGAPFAGLIEASSRAEAQARIAEGRLGALEVRLAARPDRVAHLYLSAAAGRALAYLVDVSEQKQMEAQLSQTHKMQAVGLLAGGVAHDINNMLSAIQLRLDDLLQRHPAGDPAYQGLSEIRQVGARVAELVRKLLAFSRKQTLQRETIDLGDLINDSAVLLRRLLHEDVRLETDYGRGLPQIRADRSQIETAIMNLAVNARDAMRGQERATPGVVRIRGARVTQAEAQAFGYADAPAADLALIEVADSGPGIPPHILPQIFEPFFTTKAQGEGTGLGLATVYGIVKQADGYIHVESPHRENGMGHGASFRIFLPVYVAPLRIEPPAPVPRARAPARDLSGVGRILFVEDEDTVRGIAAHLLRARGYEVIEAADGEEALELAELHAGQIDLLISDVIMPGMDGPTLLRKARPFLGAAPVMFISGYAEAEFSDLLEGEAGVTFLAKPLDIKSLAEKVKQQLAG